MSHKFFSGELFISISLLIVLYALPVQTNACGCGCNVFYAGNRWMMAPSTGLKLNFQYSYMMQNQGWNLLHSAPLDSLADKEIRTSYYNFGLQYMFTREWGIMAEVPYWNRYFATTDDNGSPVSAQHSSIGDMQILGMYSGFFEDMSTSLLFGVKLPIGSFMQSMFDRDTQIGTGTTDIMLGTYRIGQEKNWGWFAYGMWQHALNTRDDYRPGDSFDMNLGFHYDGIFQSTNITPMLQVIASFRGSDSGTNSHPEETGYQRVFVSPGFEYHLSSNLQFFADMRIPVVTNVKGYQLVAPLLWNASVSLSL